MKKTKIICSIGPMTQTWEKFKGLVDAGMNVARINFSHATIEERKLDESLVERARKELGANIAILYDTKGPDLRTCNFQDDKIELVAGKTIRIVEEDVIGTSEKISLNYKGILKDVEVGMSILVDDGFYKLVVVSKEKDGVTCEIKNSGTIKSRRGVCIPGIKLDVPYVSDKDKEDIKYACDMDGDYLAISFVNSADDIKAVRDLCKEYGKPNMPIISKVETQYAMDNLQEIVEASDYIMVARGD
ncbi:MAG: pyruvate kinase, partial [Bacilli bacterium]|nr:pyruvate kinase [Bacilli bacterium]